MPFDIVIEVEPLQSKDELRVLAFDLGEVLLHHYKRLKPPIGPDDDFHLFASVEAVFTDVGYDILGPLFNKISGVQRTSVWCTAHTFWFSLKPRADLVTITRQVMRIIERTYVDRRYNEGLQLPAKPSYGCALNGEGPVPLSLDDPILLGRLRRLGAPQEVSEAFIQDALNRLEP